jgi:hypothetical protein
MLKLPKNARQELTAERARKILMVKVNAGQDTTVHRTHLSQFQQILVSFHKASEMRNKSLVVRGHIKMNMVLLSVNIVLEVTNVRTNR